MTVDPKWLEILKASGWQTTGLAAALGLFLLAAHKAWIPSLPAIFFQLVVLGLLVCAGLSLASIASAVHRFFPAEIWLKYWVDVARSSRQIVEYIPHMTEREKAIIRYLLIRNQSTFTADGDGGYARTLLARGIVTIVVAPGQQVVPTNVPMMVPRHVWRLLKQHRLEFGDLTIVPNDDEDAPPWRIPWMAR